MALYHFHVEQIKRSEGRTAVASAPIVQEKNCIISGMEKRMITQKRVELS